jgi:hypothetical protein
VSVLRQTQRLPAEGCLRPRQGTPGHDHLTQLNSCRAKRDVEVIVRRLPGRPHVEVTDNGDALGSSKAHEPRKDTFLNVSVVMADFARQLQAEESVPETLQDGTASAVQWAPGAERPASLMMQADTTPLSDPRVHLPAGKYGQDAFTSSRCSPEPARRSWNPGTRLPPRTW